MTTYYEKFKTAATVRDYFKLALNNELGGPESSLAIRSYDDVYPMVAVVDKNDPGRTPHLEIKVYSPIGDDKFKIAYSGRNIYDGRIDCPEDAAGLERIAKMLADIVKSKNLGYNSAGNESNVKSSERLEYEKGHKNSKGEDAPWVILSHQDDRILASFAKKADAEKHLARMKTYSKN